MFWTKGMPGDRGPGADKWRGLVGDDLDRSEHGGGKGTVEERPRRRGLPSGRDVHVDDLPVLVHGPVDVPPGAGNLHMRLIDVPPRSGRVPRPAGARQPGTG